MTMDTASVQRLYDRFSSVPGLWQADALFSRATEFSPYRARVIGRLGIGPSSRVLDVACGTGLNFDLLQRVTRGEGDIVGIDVSRKTLGLARRRVARQKWDNVGLVETDCAGYRTDEKFDAALCTFAVEIIPPWRETIDMMIESVRPGGRLGFIGFQESSQRPFSVGNPLWRRMCSAFGPADLDRDVPSYVLERCDEVLFDSVYGGLYYLLVAGRRA
jgi:ubiquinone/menaquinone biosynthesis C-methylase UbiE